MSYATRAANRIARQQRDGFNCCSMEGTIRGSLEIINAIARIKVSHLGDREQNQVGSRFFSHLPFRPLAPWSPHFRIFDA
jgi:hypothetical protein